MDQPPGGSVGNLGDQLPDTGFNASLMSMWVVLSRQKVREKLLEFGNTT